MEKADTKGRLMTVEKLKKDVGCARRKKNAALGNILNCVVPL
jgi:hypothetical protein